MPGKANIEIRQVVSREEAAAIAAAVSRFRDDHAPLIAPAGPALTPWQQAALLEGTGREPDSAAPWSR